MGDNDIRLSLKLWHNTGFPNDAHRRLSFERLAAWLYLHLGKLGSGGLDQWIAIGQSMDKEAAQ